jgi:hypothetical protein
MGNLPILNDATKIVSRPDDIVCELPSIKDFFVSTPVHLATCLFDLTPRLNQEPDCSLAWLPAQIWIRHNLYIR